MIYFISDTHFGHKKVIDFGKRPFKNVEEMDEQIINNWNSVVAPSDTIYHLGDVGWWLNTTTDIKKFRNVMGRLSGRKVLILGNHDLLNSRIYSEYFDEVCAYKQIDEFVCTHIPMHPRELIFMDGCINLHGHTHTDDVVKYNYNTDVSKDCVLNGDKDMRYINLSIEKTNYAPISLDEIRYNVNNR